jgi:hypothetical protein
MYRGKKFSHSRNIDQPPVTVAIGVYKASSETRHELTAEHHQSWHDKYPEGFHTFLHKEYLSIEFLYADQVERRQEQLIESGYDIEVIPVING